MAHAAAPKLVPALLLDDDADASGGPLFLFFFFFFFSSSLFFFAIGCFLRFVGAAFFFVFIFFVVVVGFVSCPVFFSRCSQARAFEAQSCLGTAPTAARRLDARQFGA